MNPRVRGKLIQAQGYNCRTCDYLKKLSLKKDWRKTDDGGVNWKYDYIWTVECLKEGRFTERVEGTANFAPVPRCSLWRNQDLDE